jgi:flagellar protein FliS
MDQRLRNFYMDSQVSGATPGQLLIMLYDLLIEHAEAADVELSAPESPTKFAAAAKEVTFCIKVLTELTASLRHGENPTLCATLGGLYEFFTREFYAALDEGTPDKVRKLLPMIRELRVAWASADRLAGKTQPDAAAVAA